MSNVDKQEIDEALDEIEDERFENSPMGWWILGECLGCFASPPSECVCNKGDVMSNIEQLQNKLDEMKLNGLTGINFYPSEHAYGADPEDVAREILDMFAAKEAGKTRVLRFNDSQKRLHS